MSCVRAKGKEVVCAHIYTSKAPEMRDFDIQSPPPLPTKVPFTEALQHRGYEKRKRDVCVGEKVILLQSHVGHLQRLVVVDNNSSS